MRTFAWRIPTMAPILLILFGCGEPHGNMGQQGSQDSGPTNDSQAVTAATGSGPPRQNKLLRLAVTGSGFDPAAPAAPPGQRYYTIGLRGVSRSNSDVGVDIQRFVFAQDDRGCLSRPAGNAPWLKHPFGAIVVFTAAQQTEGQLAFAVPEDAKQLRVLLAPSEMESLAVPAGEDFRPSWPAAVSTIEDGTALRVLVLPRTEPTTLLPPAAAGRMRVVLDFVIENLKSTQGIEFTTSQQLRLVDAQGKFVQPDSATMQLGCRLEDGDVIPPSQPRRFMVAYELPTGTPLRLHYRGFEVDETIVALP